MKKGLTLLELLTVVTVLGILVGLGFNQYTKALEKGRTSEAKMILGQMRAAQKLYYLDNDTYGSLSDLPLRVPAACTSTNFFYYQTDSATGNCAAIRCAGNGKAPNIATGNVYSMTVDDSGVFSGTVGYY